MPDMITISRDEWMNLEEHVCKLAEDLRKAREETMTRDPDKAAEPVSECGLHRLGQSRRFSVRTGKSVFAARPVHDRLMQAPEKLAGGITHYLTNVLQPILINSELVAEMLKPGTLEREYVDQIIEAAHLGKSLIRQIRILGIREKGNLKPIALGPVVLDALTGFKRFLPPGIKLRYWIHTGNNLVKADRTQIQQLVLDLCMNAVQAMDLCKGFIGISLKETSVVSHSPAMVPDIKPGRYLKLTVRDTGRGISPEIRKRIFDLTGKDDAGTGLGIAVVKEVVRNSGGSLSVRSAAGKGTAFEIFFPIQAAAPREKRIQKTETRIRKGTHILLVDDNPAELRSIENLLVRLGYPVVSTGSPQEALRMFSKKPDDFFLLITDQVMPRIKGDVLAAHVHAMRKDIPVIICSGSEEALREIREKRSDISAFISKPFTKARLGDIIGQALCLEQTVPETGRF